MSSTDPFELPDLHALVEKYMNEPLPELPGLQQMFEEEDDMATGGFGSGMITVEKTKLLETVRKNREGHRALFIRAMEGFKKEAHDELNRLAEDVVKGRGVKLHAELDVPQDHTRDYDNAIAQLEWEMADIVSISHAQFNQLVLDKWGWSEQFVTSNAKYVK